CNINLDPYEIRNFGDCDSSPVTATFGPGQIATPGQVWRALENATSPPARHILLPTTCDIGLLGHTMLCSGVCETTNCSDVVDFVSRDDDTADTEYPNGPACAGFSPNPVDTSGGVTGRSINRTAYVGAPTTWLRADWTLSTATPTTP